MVAQDLGHFPISVSLLWLISKDYLTIKLVLLLYSISLLSSYAVYTIDVFAAVLYAEYFYILAERIIGQKDNWVN